MMRTALVWLILLSICVGGCATAPSCHEGQRIAAYSPGGKLEWQQVPYGASYVLHYPSPIAEGGKSPLNAHWTLRELARGDTIGFSRDEKGELVAIAGRERIPLVDGAYCWHVTADTQYSPLKAGLLRTGDAACETGLAILRFPLELAMGVLFVAFMTPGASLGK